MFYVFLISEIVFSTTLHVPADYSTIQAAIDASIDGDSVLVGPGTYTEYIDFNGKAIVVTSETGWESTTIKVDEFSSTGVVQFCSGEDSSSVLSGFKIRSDAGAGPIGIYCEMSSPLIENNCICSCQGYYEPSGGGIACYSGSPRIIGNLIEDNHSVSYGGGVYLYSCTGALISGNIFLSNSCGGTYMGGGGWGGGLALRECDSILVCNNIFAYNESQGLSYPLPATGVGGGVSINWSYDILLVNNTVVNNWARDYGGGLSIRASDSSCNIMNLIVFDNTCTLCPYGWQVFSLNESALSYSDVENLEDTLGVYGELIIGDGMMDIDPAFESGPLSEFHLTSSSPCVDAGNPDIQYNDPEDPDNPGYALWPALGLVRNDMGAYGGGGAEQFVSVGDMGTYEPIEDNSLSVNPNPFEETQVVRFEVQFATDIELAVYDLSGRQVEIIISGPVSSGDHAVSWVPSDDVPNGCYVVVLRSEYGDRMHGTLLLR